MTQTWYAYMNEIKIRKKNSEYAVGSSLLNQQMQVRRQIWPFEMTLNFNVIQSFRTIFIIFYIWKRIMGAAGSLLLGALEQNARVYAGETTRSMSI
jgi:hypothetical protein